MRRLFSPVSSTKGAGHSGLGLSITKKLIDEIGGSILCKSNKSGTRFQLLIPVA
jgi:nitrogen-specific signal transduction histidine kinase